MKKLVVLISSLVLVIVCLFTNMTVYADEAVGTEIEIIYTDELKIHETISSLFDAKRNQMMEPFTDSFNYSAFTIASTTPNDNLVYFERSILFQKELFAVYNACAANASTELTFKSINIVDNTATAEVYEYLTYTYYSSDTGLSDHETSIGITYSITLSKIGTEWLISDIEFYNEASECLRNASVAVQELVDIEYQAATVTASNIATNSIEEESTVSPSAVDLPLFDKERFLTYALNYDGSARCPFFYDYTNLGGDCQNFASQCLWYGLGGTLNITAISQYDDPMISPSETSNEALQWYSCSTIYKGSPSWKGPNSFDIHVTTSGNSQYRLVATVNSGLESAEVGDIIQISSTGGSTWKHSYVVVAVTGTAGSRTAANITVSAHTTDRSEQLLSTVGISSYTIQTIHVTGIKT